MGEKKQKVHDSFIRNLKIHMEFNKCYGMILGSGTGAPGFVLRPGAADAKPDQREAKPSAFSA